MLESMGSMQRVRHNLVTEQQQRIDIRDTEYIFPPDMFSSSAGKEPTCNAGDPSSIPGSVRYPGEGIGYPLQYSWASLVTQLVKNLPATQDTQILSFGWQDPLEKETATSPVFWPGEFRGLYSLQDHKKSDTAEQLSLSSSLECIGMLLCSI